MSVMLDRSYARRGGSPPDGLEYHVAFSAGGSFRVSEIWDSREQFEAFGPRLMPILAESGIELAGPPEIVEIHHIIKRWLPRRTSGRHVVRPRRWGKRLMRAGPLGLYVALDDPGATKGTRAMSLRGRFFAMTYDQQIAKVERAGLRALREELLSGASGQVLEIGAGTGANLPFYGPAVESLTLTEPEPPMFRRLQREARAQAPPAKVLRAPAEDLPFEDDTFDAAVSTLVLCGVDDQPRALRELRRVLRPGGRLLFIEHVRSDDARLARLQDRMNAINRFLVGCDCNRPTLSSIEQAGFAVTQLADTTALPKVPKFARPAIVGTATILAEPVHDDGALLRSASSA